MGGSPTPRGGSLGRRDPRATYRIIDRTAGADGPQVVREFVVQPGEAVELGDVRIQKPPG